MSPEEQSPPLPPAAPLRAPDDSISKGVVRAILWQLAAIVITIPIFCIAWGLLQWFALLPIYISRRGKGYPLMAKGVLITGFVGILINATCAALVFGNMGNMH